MGVVLDDAAAASRMSLDDAWYRVVRTMKSIQTSRAILARRGQKAPEAGADRDETGRLLDMALAEPTQPPAAAGAVKVSELLLLGEAVRILSRLQVDEALDRSGGEAAGLGCSAIQMLLDHFIQHVDSIVMSLT